MKTVTEDQFKTKYGSTAVALFPEPKPQGVLAETGQDVVQTTSAIAEDAKKRSANLGSSIEAFKQGKQGLGSTIFQGVGQSAGFGSDVIGETLKGIVKVFTGGDTEAKISEGLKNFSEGIAGIPVVQEIVKKYNALDPVTQRNLSAGGGLASLITDVATMGIGKSSAEKVAKTVVEDAVKGAEKVTTMAAKGTEFVGNVVDKGVNIASKVVEGAKNIGKPLMEEVKLIPGRLATNAAAKESSTKLIESLPSTVAKTAARSGIDVADIKALYSIPKAEKPALQKLLAVVKNYTTGVTKTNPFEVVGKPMVASLKRAESMAAKVGQKISAVADTLPSVTTKEIAPEVIKSLKAVRGLEGLKVNSKGVLDFSETTLATAGTEADRKAIQKIFIDAVKNGTGKQKHLLRQELFEILGGKKKAMVQLTGTQENAFNAIRKGLANVLDSKNSAYKALNQQYAKIMEPLKRLRKLLNVKGVSGNTEEDILNMTAGTLARRLTSHAMSNSEIRNVLNMLDKAIKVKGKTLLSTEGLQNFYNILNKYYDIAGKTSLQGQVSTGIEKTRGIMDLITGKVRDLAGESDAVRKKVLEDVLREALSQ